MPTTRPPTDTGLCRFSVPLLLNPLFAAWAALIDQAVGAAAQLDDRFEVDAEHQFADWAERSDPRIHVAHQADSLHILRPEQRNPTITHSRDLEQN